MTDISHSRTEELQETLYNSRIKKFRELGVSFEEMKENIFNKTAIPHDQLIKYGLLDGLGTYHQMKEEKVGKMMEYIVVFPVMQRLGTAHFFRSNNFEHFIRNRFLVI